MKHPNEEMAVATVRIMAIESLDPETYEAMVKALDILCETRAVNINNEIMQSEYIKLSGRDCHDSDCCVNNAPRDLPQPCNCYSSHIKSIEMNEWISVDDKLPSDRQPVTVCRIGQHSWGATYNAKMERFECPVIGALFPAITHWQPLPPPPTK